MTVHGQSQNAGRQNGTAQNPRGYGNSHASGRDKYNQATSFKSSFGQRPDPAEAQIAKEIERNAAHRYKQFADVFRITVPDDWKAEVQKYVPRRTATVVIHGAGDAFRARLTFHADNDGRERFNTPEKLERQVRLAARATLREAIEGHLHLHPFSAGGRYGALLYLTRQKFVNTDPPAGEWRYRTVGAMRLSPDSALIFLLDTNKIGDREFARLLDFLNRLARPRPAPPERENWTISRPDLALKAAIFSFGEKLDLYRPLSATLEEGVWFVTGRKLDNADDSEHIITVKLDAVDGKVLGASF